MKVWDFSQHDFALLLLIDEVSRAVSKTNSRQPYSLGDKLFRMSLRLRWANRKGHKNLPSLIRRANLLLDSYAKP